MKFLHLSDLHLGKSLGEFDLIRDQRYFLEQVLELIQEKGVDPGQILAITFTNKAASEMRERQEQMLGQALRGAWICTFHSCCVRILRMHADKLGYDSNFTIYDADDQKTVIKNICKKLDIDTKKFKENSFTMDDLLEQMQQIKKMGSMKSIIGMLPGVGDKLKDVDIDDSQLGRAGRRGQVRTERLRRLLSGKGSESLPGISAGTDAQQCV